MRKILVFIQFLLCFMCSACSSEDHDTMDTAVSRYVDSLITNQQVPGMIVLVTQKNDVLLHRAWGKAQIEPPLPLQIGTPFRIGSVTKTYVSATILKLTEQGVLDLHAPITTYLSATQLSGFPQAETVTILNLLTMRSGLYNYTDAPAYLTAIAKDPKRHWQLDTLLDYARDQPAYCEVDTCFHYSNTNFLLLELILRESSFSSLAFSLQTEIFSKLNFKNTHLDHPLLMTTDLAQGYRREHGIWLNITDYDDGRGLADGGIISTAGDMQQFFSALLLKKTLLNADSLALMETFRPTDNPNEFYGAGLLKLVLKGKTWLGHDGVVPGFQAAAFVQPESDIVVVIQTNTNSPYLEMDGILAVISEYV